MEFPEHGANPQAITKLFQLPLSENTIDFSVNVNPYQPFRQLKENWNDFYKEMLVYPDPHSTELVQKIADCENLNNGQILIGNGASELIYLLAHYFSGSDVLVIDPAFSEYRKACETFGSKVYSFTVSEETDWQVDLLELERALSGKSVLFICHPNNPTGVSYSREWFETVFQMTEDLGVVVVVDEAFYHFMGKPFSVVSYLRRFPHVVVLRSLTKMFHIPGIRLGFLLGSESFIKEVRQLQPSWSVNGVAQKVGVLCLEQTGYIADTARNIALDRYDLFSSLDRLGFLTSPSAVNFYLLRPKGEKRDLLPLIRYLLKKGIVPRHTYNFIGLDGNYLRLAVRTSRENERLLEALESWGGQ
ncbi:threonine-phosphate decarboxylase CobD [Fictibacillus gelatini]|uniref:threonine-phosphate decarboxylase CobD n=1 Tax=Fictibacillus gelatini TaxID=225985 RepID=UPI00040F11F0|nr:threonine-phosphate decarboxylase CobD [Fictibacillus gelatini]